MLERQHSSSSTNYLVSESSLYPSNVTTVVTAASKTSPSRYARDELASQFDQATLNATQRRHAFGAYKNLQGLNGVTVGSTSLESFADSTAGTGTVVDEPYTRVDYSQSYQQDPNHLSVPLTSDFVPIGSRLNFRHHSYDVPPPPPAPDDDGVRRRNLSTINRGHHSFDSASVSTSTNAYGGGSNRRENFYDDWRHRQNDFFDAFPRRNVDNVDYFDSLRRSESRYRSASYVDAMASSYHPSESRSQFLQSGSSQQLLQQQQQQQQQQSSYRASESLGNERHRRTPSPHFHRRHTEGGYDAYGQQQLHHHHHQQQQQQPQQQQLHHHHHQQQTQQQQQQQQQQHQHMYEPSTANYDHYHYSNNNVGGPNVGSGRIVASCDDRSFQDYPAAREIFYEGTNSESRLVENQAAVLKPNDNHLDSNPAFYDSRFSNPAPYSTGTVNQFSSIAPVTSQPVMTSQPATSSASQLYPSESVNITANKNFWEWNNNGFATAAFNGGVHNYDFSKAYGSGYPDVLQKNAMMGYTVGWQDLILMFTRLIQSLIHWPTHVILDQAILWWRSDASENSES